MKPGLSLPPIAALFVALWAGSIGQVLAQSGDALAGRKLAREHCARCHVIGDFNPNGGIGSTPSFQLLAKRDDWRDRFETFYARRPHPVFVRVPEVDRWTDHPSPIVEFRITQENLRHIIAFVLTLQPDKP